MTADSGSGGGAERLLFIGRIDGFRGKSLEEEEKVRELADREEIRELVAIYAHRMAHGPGAADLEASFITGALLPVGGGYCIGFSGMGAEHTGAAGT